MQWKYTIWHALKSHLCLILKFVSVLEHVRMRKEEISGKFGTTGEGGSIWSYDLMALYKYAYYYYYYEVVMYWYRCIQFPWIEQLYCCCWFLSVCWFRIVVMALVTSTKLSYVEPGLYWDRWWPLVGLPSQCLSRPLRPTQPGFPSVDWMAAVSTGSGYGHRWWRNGELCMEVCSATKIAGILCMLLKGAGY